MILNSEDMIQGSPGSVSVLINIGHPVPGPLLPVEQVCGNCGGWDELLESNCPNFISVWRTFRGRLGEEPSIFDPVETNFRTPK